MSQTIAPGLPAEGFVRMQQLVGDPGVSEEEAARLSTPDKPVEPRAPRPGVLPVTEQHLRAMVRKGLFPQPRRLGPKVVVWPVEEVRAWIAKVGGTAPETSPDEPPKGRRRRSG